MDLKSAATLIGILKDAIVGSAAIVTAAVALWGVNSWTRELRGRTEFDAALALMRAAYKLREELFASRSPLISSAEYPEGSPLREGLRADTNERWKAHAFLFNERTAGVRAALSEFDTRTLESEAILGQAVRDAVEPLRGNAFTLFAAIDAYMGNIASDGEDFKANQEFGRQIRSEVFGTRNAKDNKLSSSILSSVQQLEAFAAPHLRRK